MPRATARLQLHQAFGFDHALRVLPYYAALGISHIYASPILTARSGSTHGYDIVDPTRVNPELGGEKGLRRLVAGLRAAGMGLILDIVPNHMGIGPENPWWQHVLEWGRNSPYAHWFDIDWHPADETLRGKILAPFLGRPYGEVLSSGDIKLQFDPLRGKFHVAYCAYRFPVAPHDYAGMLRKAESARLAAAVAAFDQGRNARGDIAQQSADIGFGLLRDIGADRGGAAAIERSLQAHLPNTAQGLDALHHLLERQHYRLAWWRCAADGINWRRFFEVTDLAGVRVELDDVFEATHALIFRLYAEGLIDGVRIDHVDGLADPAGYCRKLRARLQALAARRPPESPPGPAYLIAEKILAPGEQLRTGWNIDGTSGYDFMDHVGALLHDADGEALLTALWQELTGHSADFRGEMQRARRQLLANNLAGEFEAAARALHAVARTDLRTRDYSLGAIRRVFTELLVHFPLYRTYVSGGGCDPGDRQTIEHTLAAARQSVERTEVPLLELIGRWLAGGAPRDAAHRRVRRLHLRAITRFQQLTPPLAAKAAEDTAFYRYGRLLSRNEVGSDPGQFSISAQHFHEANALRAARFPHALLATATHDHKRGEDVRARLAVLSELPEPWAAAQRDWMRMNAGLHAEVPAETPGTVCRAPLPADEVMLYQMLAGAWPVGLKPGDTAGMRQFTERIDRWQTKALREAKQVSDWVMPNEAYEAACRAFLFSILAPAPENAFLPRLLEWVDRIAMPGLVKSLAQTALRLASPGIPDLYQGTECWDLSLVDPDNRRAVDYPARQRGLTETDWMRDTGGWQSGYLKQTIIRRALAFRAEDPELFCHGAYLPLPITGTLARHAIAFARRYRDRAALLIAAILPSRLMHGSDRPAVPRDAWQQGAVMLAPEFNGTWRDVFCGRRLQVHHGRLLLRDALAVLPVALLSGTLRQSR